MRRRLFAFVLLFPLVSLACPRPDAEFGLVAGEADGRLAFVADRNSGTYVATMNVDGSGYRLTTSVRALSAPRWSPDGARLVLGAVVDSTRGLWVVDAANGDARKVAVQRWFPDEGDTPSWSPDGSRLAYTQFDSAGRRRVAIASADGTNPVALFDGERPVWAPGERIVYLAHTSEWNRGWPALHVRTVGSNDAVRITPIDGAEIIGHAVCGDGRIAYVRQGYDDTRSAWDISLRIVRPGEPGEQVLLEEQSARAIEDPAWSPDCRHLVVTRQRFLNMGTSRIAPELWVLRADGTRRWRITPRNESDTRSWANRGASWTR